MNVKPYPSEACILFVARKWILVETRLLLKELDKTEYVVVNNLHTVSAEHDNILSRVSKHRSNFGILCKLLGKKSACFLLFHQ